MTPAVNIYRCQPCDTDWPKASTYERCPKCRGETFASYGHPAPSGEAKALADKWKAFHAYCEQRAADQAKAFEELVANV